MSTSSYKGYYGQAEVFENKMCINSRASALLPTLSICLKETEKSKEKYALAIKG